MNYESAVLKYDILEKIKGFRISSVPQMDLGVIGYGVSFRYLMEKVNR